jgi:hypothetical protein
MINFFEQLDPILEFFRECEGVQDVLLLPDMTAVAVLIGSTEECGCA